MILNKYGVLIKKYLKENYPIRYQELIMTGELMNEIRERQEDVMEQKGVLEQNFKLKLQNKDYFEKVQEERQVQNQIEEILQELMYQHM